MAGAAGPTGRAAPFKRILVPLDGSDLAERALPFARTLACLGQGELILVRVSSAPPGSAMDEEAHYLEQIAEAARDDCPVQTLVLPGDPAHEILAAAAARQADLVVMSTHGRGGVTRLVLGSVAGALLRHLEVPLLLVRGALSVASWDGGLRRILLPLDESGVSERALGAIAELARAARAELVLFEAVGPPAPDAAVYEIAYLPDRDAQLSDQARQRLRALVQRVSALGLSVTSEVVVGKPVHAILEAATRYSVDLIAMTTHARGGVERLVLGSVADEVLRASPAPLLLIRP